MDINNFAKNFWKGLKNNMNKYKELISVDTSNTIINTKLVDTEILQKRLNTNWWLVDDINIGNYKLKRNVNKNFRRELNFVCIPNTEFLCGLNVYIWNNNFINLAEIFLNKSKELKIDQFINGYSDKEKFEYMINYGINLDSIKFMSHREFLGRCVDKLINTKLIYIKDCEEDD